MSGPRADDERAQSAAAGSLPWRFASAAVLLGAPAVGALLLHVFAPAEASSTGSILLAAVCLVVWASTRRAGPRLARALVAASVLVGVPAWGEVGLRAAGFHPGTARIEFGYPRPAEIVHLEQDPELFWKLPSRLPGVNSHGLPGPEWIVPKPEGFRRLVFLGDSCTEQGYPGRVVGRLNQDSPRFLAANLSTSGYSSYQGTVLAHRWLEHLQPDLVALYFGWNDHWLAWGASDRAKRVRRPSWVERTLRASRLSSALRSLTSASPAPSTAPRVSLEEYRANLVSIGEQAEALGATPLLLTAAGAHAQRGVPRYLIERHFAVSDEEVLRLHRAYNDVVRELADQRGWLLADLAREVEQDPGLVRYFKDDGIHWTDEGLDWVAARIVARLRQAGCFDLVEEDQP